MRPLHAVLTTLAPVAVALTVASAPRVALAEPTLRERAIALRDEGRKHAAAGDSGRARDVLTESYALLASSETACDLGEAEVNVSDFLSASDHLEVCVRGDAPADAKKRGEAAFVKAKAALGALTVVTNQRREDDPSPPTPLEGALVYVDGAPRAPAAPGAPIWVAPGTHELRAESFGYKGASTVVALAAGDETSVNLTLEAPPITKPPSKPSFAPAIVAFGLGLAGVGVGIGFIVLHADQDEAAEKLGTGRHCTSSEDPACADIADAQSTANDSGNIAVGAFAVGGAAAGTGAILLYWAIVKSKPAMRDMSSLPFVAPRLSADGALDGVVFGGRF